MEQHRDTSKKSEHKKHTKIRKEDRQKPKANISSSNSETSNIRKKPKTKITDKTDKDLEEMKSEKERIQNRKKDSRQLTPSKIEIDDDLPVKNVARKKPKRVIKVKTIKKNTDNSSNNQNKEIKNDLKEPPPLAIPVDVANKLKQKKISNTKKTVSKEVTKPKNSKNANQENNIKKIPLNKGNQSNVNKKVRKKRVRRIIRKKPDPNNQNMRVSLHKVIPKKDQPSPSSDSFEEEESNISINNRNNKQRVDRNRARPSSSASSTKSSSQKQKDSAIKGKNFNSDASNNSRSSKKASSSSSVQKIPIPEEIDEPIDTVIDEEKEKKEEIPDTKPINIPAQNDDEEEDTQIDDNQDDKYDEKIDDTESSNGREEEEEEDYSEEEEASTPRKDSSNKISDINQNSPQSSISSDYSFKKEILSPIPDKERRSLSDGTLKDGVSGIFGGLDDDDSSSSNRSPTVKRRSNRNVNIIFNAKKQTNPKSDRIAPNDRNRRNSDPTLDFVEFNDSASNSSKKKKVNFVNRINQDDEEFQPKRKVSLNIIPARNKIRNQSMRVQKFNNFGKAPSNPHLANNGSPVVFAPFTPRPLPHSLRIQNYANARFPINDDEFHDFDATKKNKRIDFDPPIDFQIKIIPNPPIIAIDAELAEFSREKLLREIKNIL